MKVHDLKCRPPYKVAESELPDERVREWMSIMNHPHVTDLGEELISTRAALLASHRELEEVCTQRDHESERAGNIVKQHEEIRKTHNEEWKNWHDMMTALEKERDEALAALASAKKECGLNIERIKEDVHCMLLAEETIHALEVRLASARSAAIEDVSALIRDAAGKDGQFTPQDLIDLMNEIRALATSGGTATRTEAKILKRIDAVEEEPQ